MTQSILDQIKAQAELAASTGPDMTEAVKGGAGSRVLPDGYAFGRLVEYIEFGAQPQEFKGVAKDPALEFQLGFALTGQGYTNDDGTPYIMRPWSMAMSRNEKARAFLLFKALNWKGTAKHFAQLLGEGFLVKIVNPKPTDPAKKVRSEIDLKGFLPPLDPVTKMPYPIAPAREEDFRIFLWDHPNLANWDALFIEGNYEDGKSKNFVQDKMLSAVDFAGSALEALLVTSNKPFVRPAPKAAPAVPSAPVAPAAAPVPIAAPAPVSVPVSAVPFPEPHQPVAPPAGIVAPTTVTAPVVPVGVAPPVVVAAVPAPVVPAAVPFPEPHQPVNPAAAAAIAEAPASVPVAVVPSLPAMPAAPALPSV